MIFVTVGTHEQPFNRLVKYMDEWAAEHDEAVIIQTGYSTYYHNGRFANNLIVNGVDISDWQSKKCNFAQAKAAGVDYSIMRVTWTSYGRSKLTLHNDENFSYQYANAKANGVMCGVYVFSQATNVSEGVAEANFAIKRLRELGIGPKDLALPVYMDYEFAGGRLGRMYGISRTAATNAAVAFCNTIKNFLRIVHGNRPVCSGC